MSSRATRKRAWRKLLAKRRVRVYDADEIVITIGGVTISSKDAARGDRRHVARSGRWEPVEISCTVTVGPESPSPYDRPSRNIRPDHPALALFDRAKTGETREVTDEDGKTYVADVVESWPRPGVIKTDLVPCGELHHATGEALDRLGELYGIPRHPSEGDQ